VGRRLLVLAVITILAGSGGAAHDAASRTAYCEGASAYVAPPEAITSTSATLVARLAVQGCGLSFSFVLDGPSGELVTPGHLLGAGGAELYERYTLVVTGLEPGAAYVVSGKASYPGGAYVSGQQQFRTLARLDVLLRGQGRVVSAPTAIDCGSVCGVDLPIGGGFQLTATPAAGYRFGHWEGDACQSASPVCAAWVTTWARTTAVFDQAALVSVTRGGSGTGAVSSAPAGIDCGGTCSATFDPGAAVTLTATPEPGSRFDRWSGACAGSGPACTFTTTVGTDGVNATFVKLATLTVTRTGRGKGKVTDATGKIDCGVTCTGTFDDGATATLRATPARGSLFAGWSGACTGKAPTCSVALNGSDSVAAAFKPKPKPKKKKQRRH
jgi:Divergent InlB B-repeat domain